MPQDLVSQKDDSGSCDLPLCKSPTLIMADAKALLVCSLPLINPNVDREL